MDQAEREIDDRLHQLAEAAGGDPLEHAARVTAAHQRGLRAAHKALDAAQDERIESILGPVV